MPRLLVLVAVLVVGLLLFWQFGRSRPAPTAPPLVAGGPPEPVEPDRSVAFESVTDRTPMSLRDNAAYSLLLERARARTPAELAQAGRRDLFMTHLWERPERYRGVPVHIDGTALRVLRYDSRLSKTGWLYEAWIGTPEAGRFPYVCVFEDAPEGLPIGPNLSERVVFNGYFLKILKYEAADVARGAPLLVGRIGWDPHRSSEAQSPGSGSTLRWTLILLALMFVVTLARWISTLGRSMGGRKPSAGRPAPLNDEIDPDALRQWVQDAGREEAPGPGVPEPEGDAGVPGPASGARDGPVRSEDSGARPPDEAQSTSSP